MPAALLIPQQNPSSHYETEFPGGTGSTSTGIQPCHVLYEDLARDRLAVTNKVLEYLRLPQLDAGDLPPVRYRKQADSLTERYADLVRSAMNSRSTRDP